MLFLRKEDIDDDEEIATLKHNLDAINNSRVHKTAQLMQRNAAMIDRDAARHAYFRETYKTPEELAMLAAQRRWEELGVELQRVQAAEEEARADEEEEAALEFQLLMYVHSLSVTSLTVAVVTAEVEHRQHVVALREEAKRRSDLTFQNIKDGLLKEAVESNRALVKQEAGEWKVLARAAAASRAAAAEQQAARVAREAEEAARERERRRLAEERKAQLEVDAMEEEYTRKVDRITERFLRQQVAAPDR